MLRRANELQHIRDQRKLGQLFTGDDSFNEAQIHLVAQKPRLQQVGVFHIQIGMNVGILEFELVQDGSQERIADGKRGAQAKLPHRMALFHGATQLFIALRHLLGMLPEDHALGRQSQLPCPTLKKRRIKLLLQIENGLAYGGLGEI